MPLTHTSAWLLMRPSASVLPAPACGTSTVRVNQTTPSKSARPRDSQLHGTCISFHSEPSAAESGVRQSGLVVHSRSGVGKEFDGTASGYTLYTARTSTLSLGAE